VPLLIVPCGSANDFARARGLRQSKDSVNAWRRFVHGEKNIRQVDLGIIAQPNSSHYFCCVAGVGLDSQITRRANDLPRWFRKHGGYALTAPREFLRFAPFPMKISLDGNSADGISAAPFKPMTLAAVANAPTYGGGMKIAPHAKLDDGKLDLCAVRGMDVFKLFCLFPTVFLGRHLGIEAVEYEQTERIRIETEHPLDVYADGEFVCQTPVEFSVARDVLKVIVPG